MREILSRVLDLLEPKDRVHLGFVLGAVVIMALVETVAVASIFPFMSLVADPDVVQRTPWMAELYARGGFETPSAFLFAAGLGVLGVLVFSNAFSAATTWGILRFLWGLHHSLGKRLLQRYLAEPYAFFLRENTTRLTKNILSEAYTVVHGVLVPAMDMLARGIVTLAILTLLVLIDPVLALVITAVLGSLYGTMYVLVRKRQAAIGRERLERNADRYRVVGEAFGGVKELKVLGREAELVRRFHLPSFRFSMTSAGNDLVVHIPRFALEAIGFGGILIIILYLLRGDAQMHEVIPMMSLYAFAGYRLMPALQKVLIGLTTLRFNTPALREIHADLMGGAVHGPQPAEQVAFQKEIQLRDVFFRYEGASVDALSGVDLTFTKDRTTGLVGATGSGKTTLADLVLGLFPPRSGEILVDGVPLSSKGRVRGWQDRLGYVPQAIFLADASILSNVAFGLPLEEVDEARVREVLRMARLDDFVADLPLGVETVVGERGVRLSGGQRQRIGIARALYHDPDVLILDEATSALDGETEQGVMDAINSLAHQKTIIIIAHRLRTVEECDEVVILHDGRVEDQGPFHELLVRSERLRRFAREGNAGGQEVEERV